MSTAVLRLLVAVVLMAVAAEGYRGHQQKDLYKTMNLTSSATTKQIKKMYQKWSRMLHPDITKWPIEVAKARMIEITEAYEIISDEERREKYDKEGKMDIGTDANTEWARAKLFDGDHDVFTFKTKEQFQEHVESGEHWMVLFWSKNYAECLEASVVWHKFATRMKGVLHIGTANCDDVGYLCRALRMQTLPTIFSIKGKRTHKYTGKIEPQSLVEYAADNLLIHGHRIKDYSVGLLSASTPIGPAIEKATPGLSLSSGSYLATPPSYTLAVPEVWDLMTFEYTACMDCRYELSLAMETLQKYSRGEDSRAIRVDCTLEANANFCKQAPRGKRAWRVARATRTSYYAPLKSAPGGWQPIKSTKLNLEWFPSEDKQWFTRDITRFVFSHQRSSIFRLTPKAFYRMVLKEVTAWAILFTSSDESCTSCGHYSADWEIMARITQGYISPKGTKLRVASIDCTRHHAFCSSLGLTDKLPALRMWRGGIKAKKQEPHHLGLMDPASMLRDCQREMEPLTLVDMNEEVFNVEVRNTTGEATKPNNWFILYNAGTWCPPCNAIRQPWKDTTRLLEASTISSKIKLGVVDCETEGQFCRHMNIESYPTMHLFLQGRRSPVEFDGDRAPESMMAFVEDKIDNHVVQLSPGLLREKSRSRKAPLLVAFQAGNWCPPCMALKPDWRKVANDLHPMTVGAINCDNDQATCRQFGIEGYPMVVLYPNGPDRRGKHAIFQGNKDPQAIVSWVKKIMGSNFKFYPRED